VAVANQPNNATHKTPDVAVLYDGTGWTVGASILPDVRKSESVAALSCPSAAFCAATGYLGDAIIGRASPFAPDPPSGVAGAAGDGQVTTSWIAPTGDGGSPITGYDVQYSSDAGVHWTSASSAFHTSTATTQTVTGLANGTAYIFRVAAINGVGTGPYSAASSPVTPHAAEPTPTPTATATSTSTPTPTATPTISNTPTTTPSPTRTTANLSSGPTRTIKIGQDVTVSTILTSQGSPLPIAPVDLLGRLGTSGEWKLLRSLTTDAQGRISTTIAPSINCQIAWSFPGDQTHLPAMTNAQNIRVRQVMTVHRSAERVRVGHVVQIYGLVSPHSNGQTAVLQRFRNGRWLDIRRAEVIRQRMPGGNSGFGYVVNLVRHHPATLRLRVHIGATAYNVGASTRRFALRVT
jgi:hypothetical protein